jgi:hypothetical protein
VPWRWPRRPATGPLWLLQTLHASSWAVTDLAFKPTLLGLKVLSIFGETFQHGLIVLPKVNNCQLSTHVEWSCDLKHLSDTRYYSLIPTGNGSFRIGHLALGGPFQPEVDYRPKRQDGYAIAGDAKSVLCHSSRTTARTRSSVATLRRDYLEIRHLHAESELPSVGGPELFLGYLECIAFWAEHLNDVQCI